MRFGTAASAALAVALACLCTLAAAPAGAAGNSVFCGNGWSTNGSCKYSQDKITWTCTSYTTSGRCIQATLQTTRFKGATASGTCDPSNNVKQWRLASFNIYTFTGVRLKTQPAQAWRTNCALSEHYWTYNLSTRESLRVVYVFEHQLTNGSNFVTTDVQELVLGL